MTAYNRELYIAEAIESVLASSYKNFELIILDDCSVDKTVQIARKYEAEDPRIKVYVNEKNLGQFANRNKAASYAQGKYIKYLDSDDKILGFGLSYCVEAMEKYPAAGMALYYHNTNGENAEPEYSEPEKSVREHFFNRHHLFTGPSATIMRRDKFEEMGRFDTRFGVPSDVFFNVKFASAYPVVLLPQLFIYYRRHDGQEINNSMDYLKYGYLYFKELLLKVSLPLTPKEKKYLYKKMQKRHSVNLSRFIWKTKKIKTALGVMKETGFSLPNYFKSFFY